VTGRLAFAAVLVAASATISNGAGAQEAAPCPATSYSLYGAGHEPAAPQILAAVRHEVPRVLHLSRQGESIDLRKPGSYEVTALAYLGQPRLLSTKPWTIAAHRCGERVAGVSWLAEINVPEAAGVAIGLFWLYLIDTTHGWHVWYVYCPYC
jgi:hypothetical protein